MEDDKLIEKLEEGVREAQELLDRRKAALAALKGKAASGSGKRGLRGFRAGSIPALAHAALKGKQPHSLDELTAAVKKNKDVEPRDVSLALSKYIRKGQYFMVDEHGKYSVK